MLWDKSYRKLAMNFSKAQWMANGWATVDIEPHDAVSFLPILVWLCGEYQIPFPVIIDTIDGYAADFELSGSQATFWIDAWTFAIGFENPGMRDAVYDRLIALPDGCFDV